MYRPSGSSSRRRQDGRRGEADASSHPQPDWSGIANLNLGGVVPQLVPVFPAPFASRHFEPLRPHSPLELGQLFDTPARSPRVGPSRLASIDGGPSLDIVREPLNLEAHVSPAESSLRELHHQLSTARSVLTSYHDQWKATRKDVTWAGKKTLEKFWPEMLQAKLKDSTECDRFYSLRDNIAKCARDARRSSERGCFLDTPRNEHLAGRRKRIVRKACISCDAVVDLFDEATLDLAACEVLLREIDDAVKTVDPANKDLYGGGEDTKRGKDSQDQNWNEDRSQDQDHD